MLASAPNIIVASHKIGITTIHDLIARAKTQKINYGSPGIGSQLHLAMELLKEKAGIDLMHVPYRGSSQALNNIVGDHIDLLVTNLPAALDAIRGGNVVPLAMTTAQRSPLVPDVPTLREAGITGIDVTSWYGLLAPNGIAPQTRDTLISVTTEILSAADMQTKLQAQGLSVMLEPTDQFAARVRAETALWADIIKSRNIKPR